MAPPIIKLDDIHLTFGGTPLLDGAELQVEPEDRICLVGRNGSGKSTLMKIVAGLVEPQSGEVFRHPRATVRYLEQAPDFAGFDTVRDYALAGLAPGDNEHRVSYLLDHLGLTGDENPARLSGGESRRAALARVLAPRPDVLLLDEPTNHLDLPTIEWLERELRGFRGALVVISHDRQFLKTVSRETVWIDRGQTRRLDRGFAAFEDWQNEVLEEEERAQHKLGRAIVREEHWLRYGVTARRKRNMRRLGELQTMREQHRSHRGPTGLAKMQASDAKDSGKLVIEAEGLVKRYDGQPIVDGFSLRVHRGDRIGFIGPNGAGKTTLLKLLTGQLQPDAGSLRIGTNLEIAILDQKRDDLEPEMSLEMFLTDGRGSNLVVNGEQKHVTGYMKDFLFQPEQARTPIRELSGGEKARLLLAKMLARPANLIIFDEPTNDLDMETLDLLQELIAGFAGTVLLVSHDRDFLDRTVTSVIAPARMDRPDGRWITYAGGYTDMLVQKSEHRDPARTASSSGSAEGAAQKKAGARERKLSYKQKFALESLPGKIAESEAKAAEVESLMADPEFFARDPEAFNRAAEDLASLKAKLEAMEEEWLELEMLREEIESDE